VRDGYLRGALPRTPTAGQVDVIAAFVAVGGSVADAAEAVGIRPSTAKRHLADLRARSGLTTEQLIYRGRAEGWLAVPSLDSYGAAAAGRPLRARGSGGPTRRAYSSRMNA
jgi:predicted ArsR family transcriptional regulator